MEYQALSTCLELLLHELPDPDQELAIQQFNSLRFTLFPKFPLELRRIIWTRALPTPRRVCLYVCRSHYQQPNSRPLPATLRANQESRQVTLENYVIPLFPLQSSLKDLPTGEAGKSENSVQDLGASRDNDCMPLGRMVSCFDPVRDTLYLDIRTPHDPGFKNTMAELQRVFPKEFNKVRQMELSNASLESLIIGALPYSVRVSDDLRAWPVWTLGFFPSLANLTLLPGTCSEESDEGSSIRDLCDRVYDITSQEHRDANFLICLTACIEIGAKSFGQWSIPKIDFKH